MKIRWGSTHVMLKRALSRRSVSAAFPIVSYNNLINNIQCIDIFVYEMGCIAGGESIEKRRKIDSLRLTGGEWERVQTFEKLLAVCAHLHFQ
jgi:protein gp37